MRKDIRDVLNAGAFVLSDGGLGTMLQSKGLPAGVMPEAWNQEKPEIVQSVHRAYAAAGSQSVTTNSFGGNRIRLTEGGLGDQVVEINRLAVELAREAVGDEVWVAGSVGPTGKLLEPYGALTQEKAESVFAEQVIALAEGGADLILVETQHDLEEASCAVRMAKEHTDLPVFCTFAFNEKGRTMMGMKPQDAAQRMEELGVDAIGANCGDGPAAILAGLQGFHGATELPLIAQSNAGIPQAGVDSQTTWDVTPEQLVEAAQEFLAQGARVIGGCCGTGPAHIAALAGLMEELRQR